MGIYVDGWEFPTPYANRLTIEKRGFFKNVQVLCGGWEYLYAYNCKLSLVDIPQTTL